MVHGKRCHSPCIVLLSALFKQIHKDFSFHCAMRWILSVRLSVYPYDCLFVCMGLDMCLYLSEVFACISIYCLGSVCGSIAIDFFCVHFHTFYYLFVCLSYTMSLSCRSHPCVSVCPSVLAIRLRPNYA